MNPPKSGCNFLPGNLCICLAFHDPQGYGLRVDQFRWQVAAACKGIPSYVFFPEEKGLPGFKEDPRFKGKTYREYCGSCPVMRLCRSFAVLHDTEGVWGDMNDSERRSRYVKEERWEMRNDREDMGLYEPLYGHS